MLGAVGRAQPESGNCQEGVGLQSREQLLAALLQRYSHTPPAANRFRRTRSLLC